MSSSYCCSGATSYEDLCTYEDVLYPTFREASIACGLTEDDNEWHQCLEEAKHMAVGRQMRQLFVTILKDCNPADSRVLWDTFWQDICDDLKCHAVFRCKEGDPSDEDIQDYGLYLIDQLLAQSGKRLSHWDCLSQVTQDWGAILDNLNPLIVEQRDYSLLEQTNLANQHIPSLNPDQCSAFDQIDSAVANSEEYRQDLSVQHPLLSFTLPGQDCPVRGIIRHCCPSQGWPYCSFTIQDPCSLS